MSQDQEQPVARLGRDGAIPLVGIGTWQMTGAPCQQAVRYAVERGYRHVDTATIYGNEREVGRAVRESGVPRGELFITTKLPPRNVGRERRTLQASLRALEMEYVDLWLIHWPPHGQASPRAWEELLAARDEGLARAVGVSNYSTRQIDELVRVTGQAPVVNQIRWAPTLYDARRLAEHRERGIVLEGYSPFKSSDLRHPVLAEIAAHHEVTPAQVVLRWHIEHEVVVIPKSRSPERIASNFDVFGFSLSDEERRRVDALSTT